MSGVGGKYIPNANDGRDMDHDVYVVQIVADGPDGFPADHVAEIGICGVSLSRMDADSVYGEVVALDPRELGKRRLDYLEERAGITAGELYAGTPEEKVIGEVKSLLQGGTVAAYDIKNVFYYHLLNGAWDLTGTVSFMPAISARLDRGFRPAVRGDENIGIRKAYEAMCPGDPMGVGGGSRALDCAQMSAAVMMELRRAGRY